MPGLRVITDRVLIAVARVRMHSVLDDTGRLVSGLVGRRTEDCLGLVVSADCKSITSCVCFVSTLCSWVECGSVLAETAICIAGESFNRAPLILER